MPVTSPTAHRRSPARRCASTSMPCGPACGADRFQPLGHARAPAGGDEDVVAAQLAAVLEGQHVVLAVAGRGGRAHAEDELDAVPPQALAERLAERRRLVDEHVRGRLDQGHLAAQAAHGLRHLGADRAAAEDEQPPRDGLHAGHLAVGPGPFQLTQPGDGRHHRVGPGRHDHVPGGVPHAVDLDHARPGEPPRPAQQVDALVRQPALLPGVGVVRDHEVTPGKRRRHVDLRAGADLACALHRLAGAQQRLGRDARVVRALAADQLALHQGHAQAAVGQRPGAVLAGRAATHHDDVVLHGSGSPAWISPSA